MEILITKLFGILLITALSGIGYLVTRFALKREYEILGIVFWLGMFIIFMYTWFVIIPLGF